MFKDISDTLVAYGSAFSVARKYNLYSYLWLSGLISLSIGLLILFFIYFFSDDLGVIVSGIWRWDWGSEVFATMSTYLSAILIGGLAFFVYKYLIMILVAPIMSPLSERLEEHIRGYPDGEKLSISRLIKEMSRGLSLALRNIVREIFFTVILLILSLFPFIGLLTGPAIYAVQSYYAGFGNLDYCLERHLGIKDSIAFVRQYRWAAITNGAVFLLILLIPIIGLFLAPFMSTIAGTIVIHHRLK